VTVFKKINAKIKNFIVSGRKKGETQKNSSRGQISIVLMFVIAAALIFYAVSLNIGKMSTSKTIVTMASNAGASKMASNMASYGQAIFQQSLGGKKRICGLTGIAAAIVSIIVIIICIIIIAASYGASTPAATAFWMACVGLVLALVALAIQITYIQPGITEMWNKIIAETMEMSDQFVEMGIQTGLSGSVTDSKLVPDLDDLDSDRVFGLEDDGYGYYTAKDVYSRYAKYYNARLREIKVLDSTPMSNFQDALKDFVYADVNTDWGIYDPEQCPSDCCYGINPNVLSYCNQCCVPDTLPDPTDTTGSPEILDIRPECCDVGGEEECGVAGTCINSSLSPYIGGAGGDYPFVFDAHTENLDNGFYSFMENLGSDDEHIQYQRNMTGMSPALGTGVVNPDFVDGLPQITDSTDDFRIEDTSGFMGMDQKEGIFSYFHKLQDWGIELKNSPLCQWCDSRNGITCGSMHAPLWEQPQLSLAQDPGGGTLSFDTSYCVDDVSANTAGTIPNGLGRNFPLPPVAVDKVTIADNIIADPDECAQEIFRFSGGGVVENTTVGFWKKGADRMCDTDGLEWPYYGGCPGKGMYDFDGYSLDCSCIDALDGTYAGCISSNVPNFHEDIFDDLVYGLPEFIDWANEILSYSTSFFRRDLVALYSAIADWIEPLSPPATTTTDPPCYNCGTSSDPHVGGLVIWQEEMRKISERIANWLEDGGTYNYRSTSNFNDGAGGDVWCIPSDTTSLLDPSSNCISSAENASIHSQGFHESSLTSVVNCLDWNVNDDWGGVVSGGNLSKFEYCMDASTCRANEVLCAESLPRSLVPDFCTDHLDTFIYADPANETLFEACLDTLSGTPTAPPEAGSAAGDLGDGGNVCGTTNSSQCGSDLGNDVDYEADKNCQTACNAIMPMGGRYSDVATTFVEPTYQWQDRVESCNWVDFIVPRTKDCTYREEIVTSDGDCVTTDPNGFETAVSRAKVLAGGSCEETAANEFCRGCFFDNGNGSPPRNTRRHVGFLEAITEAKEQSENQMDKLTYRYNFLNNRFTEMNSVRNMLNQAVSEFEGFLGAGSPTAALIQARIDYDNQNEKGLPYHAVYAWQDDPPDDAELGTAGPWHIVRVDARSPSRCDSRCSTDFTGPGQWPSLKTYTKSWGTKRCYELQDTDGTVKMRVTRYDEVVFEGAPGNPGDEIRNKRSPHFPGGEKIWDFRSDMPFADSTRPAPSAMGLGTTCDSLMFDDPLNLPPPYDVPYPNGKADMFKGAFLMNNPSEHTACWQRVNRLLTHGVSTETCAKYYFKEGNSMGFDLKFVPCPSPSFTSNF